MSNTLKVCKVVSMYKQVVLAKVMSWNSWSHPYRKLTNPTQSLTSVTGNCHTAWMGGENVVESSKLDTSWHDSLLLEVDSTLWLETRLETKEIKQEAMQYIPRSVNLYRIACAGNKTVHPNKKPCNVYFVQLVTLESFSKTRTVIWISNRLIRAKIVLWI